MPKRERISPSQDLADFMRKWRSSRNLTVAQAGERAGISKSAWSALENATRAASMATLYGLQRATGMEYDDLARLAGHEVRRSKDIDDRARRIAGMAAAMPRMAALIDLLDKLREDQVDTLLSVAESFNRKRE